ncbi:MAG TPA: superoxide dismutase [Steroidobacteraceae bacterium]|nr:superoxide dismutase [Steroidobacteraceae bacterium]
MTRYVLPDLEYDYGALEPHISGRIMELHHDKHHKAYVDGANKALEQLEEARHKGSFDSVGTLERTLAFNVSGHVLHSLFWRNLAPKAGGRPSGELAQALERHFGSFDAFKQQLSKTAATIQGSGWAALMWDTLSQQLLITQIHDHQSSTLQGAVPLMVLDAWEHAYYLQYFNEKAKFFEAVWNLWSWSDIAQRFAEARRFGLSVKNVADRAA